MKVAHRIGKHFAEDVVLVVLAELRQRGYGNVAQPLQPLGGKCRKLSAVSIVEQAQLRKATRIYSGG